MVRQATNTGQSSPFGAIERRIATRYLRAKKNQGGVGLIAGISFFCIMLAIWAMIVIMSIMNGFRGEVIRLTIGSEGHIYAELENPNVDPIEIKAIEDRLLDIEGVDQAFDFTQNFTGVQANNEFALGQVIGIRPDIMRDYEFITQSVVLGSFDGFGQGDASDRQIAIGYRLALGLGLNIGDRLTIYSPEPSKRLWGRSLSERTILSVPFLKSASLRRTNLIFTWIWNKQLYCSKAVGRRVKFKFGWIRLMMWTNCCRP